MLNQVNKKVNEEWIDLIREAQHLGLSIAEVKKFIDLNRKKPVSK
ncbi:DNA-binding anti-repressor SinI [Priestia megaterium]|nr:DNA-binding anti-repressor SinI [Priestia megaterium]MBM6602469.1 anti-repressor SinI family protein [Priestia megaterium]